MYEQRHGDAQRDKCGAGAELAAGELGVQRGHDLLDVAARALVLEDGRVSLTPLEFGHGLSARP